MAVKVTINEFSNDKCPDLGESLFQFFHFYFQIYILYLNRTNGTVSHLTCYIEIRSSVRKGCLSIRIGQTVWLAQPVACHAMQS